MPKLNRWSFSSLMNYERCPHSVYPGSANYDRPRPEAAQRGIEMHKQIEDFLVIGHETSVNPFPGLPFEDLAKKNPICEEKWGFNDKWYPTKDKPWLVCQIDAYEIEGSLSLLTVYDWKTGKRTGNEVKHTQQMQLYLCAATLQFPLIKNFTSSLWYVDQNLIVPGKSYTADQLNPIAQRWDKRGKKMTSDTEFEAKPSKSNCRFCDRRKDAGGNCEYEFES